MEEYCTHTFRKIISTHNWKNNSPIRSYWLRCKCCGYEWKVHYDRSAQKEVLVDRDSISRPLRLNKLTPDDVKLILTDSRSGVELARELGVSHQSINQVRNGATHRNVWPQLKRNAPKTCAPAKPGVEDCRNCTHWWQGRCGLDVPEAGNDFATECPYFMLDD